MVLVSSDPFPKIIVFIRHSTVGNEFSIFQKNIKYDLIFINHNKSILT
jgi:hypothetical protein